MYSDNIVVTTYSFRNSHNPRCIQNSCNNKQAFYVPYRTTEQRLPIRIGWYKSSAGCRRKLKLSTSWRSDLTLSVCLVLPFLPLAVCVSALPLSLMTYRATSSFPTISGKSRCGEKWHLRVRLHISELFQKHLRTVHAYYLFFYCTYKYGTLGLTYYGIILCASYLRRTYDSNHAITSSESLADGRENTLLESCISTWLAARYRLSGRQPISLKENFHPIPHRRVGIAAPRARKKLFSGDPCEPYERCSKNRRQ